MAKYKVTTNEVGVFVYEVEADSKEEAVYKVGSGNCDGVVRKFDWVTTVNKDVQVLSVVKS